MLIHVGCLAAFWTGVTWRAVALAIVLYLVRIFAIGAGYHRYFAHRAFRTSRVFQFCPGVPGTDARRSAAFCGGRPSTAGTTNTRTPRLDVHSPVQRGFLYAHVGWIFVPRNDATDYAAVRDLARYQGTGAGWIGIPICRRRCSRGATWLIAGWPGLAIGFCWSTVVLWHATFCINSLAHVVGRQRYVTGDQSQEQLAARAADDGRRLAQQPSRLPGIGPAGVPLVGVRSDLLCAARSCRGLASSGTCICRRRR